MGLDFEILLPMIRLITWLLSLMVIKVQVNLVLIWFLSLMVIKFQVNLVLILIFKEILAAH